MIEMKKAPDFKLLDQYGAEFSLSGNLGRRVLLVFYPKDGSPVCTRQLCDYNDNLEDFLKQDIEVVGISTDTQFSHKDFSAKYSLRFRILSDVDKKVSELYDALNLLGLNKRKIVLIDRDGSIIYENTVLPFFYQKSEEFLSKEFPGSLNKVK